MSIDRLCADIQPHRMWKPPPRRMAISRFYQSKLYQELSDEKSKLWHYSPMTLYTMYQDELLTGSYDYPEEA